MRGVGGGGGGREKNWQADVVDKLSRGDLTFTVFYVKSLWRLKNFEERLPISAVINSPFAGWMFCQIEPVHLDGP